MGIFSLKLEGGFNMGVYKFSLTMLRKNRKENFLYLLSIIFPISIIFNLMNIINNSNLFLTGANSGMDISADVVFVLVLLVCVFSFYANSYFILGKSKEMGIVELSGIGANKLATMLIFENAVIEVTGCAIGMLLGIILAPAFLLIMYIVMGKSGSIWMISPASIFGTIAILFLQLLYVGVGDYSYVSTREVIDLIGVNKKTRIHKNIKYFKFKAITFLIIYLIPVISTLIKDAYVISIFNIIFTAFGITGMLRYCIPQKILELKKEKYLNDKIKLVALSNLYVSLKQLFFLLITLAVSVEAILCIMAVCPQRQVKAVCMLSYITVVVLIAVSIVYKIFMEANTKRHIFNQLCLTGYTTEQIKKIVEQEFKLYYLIVIGVPLVPILSFIIMFINNGMVSVTLALIMLITFVGVFFITGLISYKVYKKLVLEKSVNRFS